MQHLSMIVKLQFCVLSLSTQLIQWTTKELFCSLSINKLLNTLHIQQLHQTPKKKATFIHEGTLQSFQLREGRGISREGVGWWLVRGAFRCNQSPIIPLRAQSLGEMGRVPASTLTLSRHAFLFPHHRLARKKTPQILPHNSVCSNTLVPLSPNSQTIHSSSHSASSRSPQTGFFSSNKYQCIGCPGAVPKQHAPYDTHHHSFIHSFFVCFFFLSFCPKVLHSSLFFDFARDFIPLRFLFVFFYYFVFCCFFFCAFFFPTTAQQAFLPEIPGGTGYGAKWHALAGHTLLPPTRAGQPGGWSRYNESKSALAMTCSEVPLHVQGQVV